MKKFKVALAAGHGGYGVTPGKRTPDGEYEWNFNNKVISSAIEFLEQYDDAIDVLRLDDPSGKTDVPLSLRSYKANAWNADVLIADHHNANTGRWGDWTGTETYTYIGNWEDAERLARIVHGNVVDVYGLRDRGLKKADFHMLRETEMPAILIEGGYMDSVIDIEKLRNDEVLRNAGIAIGKGVLEYAGIKERKRTEYNPKPTNVKSAKAVDYIEKGGKGSEVESVQDKLIDLGYDLGGYGADGIFGNATEKAVKEFQGDCGILVDGIVGPVTLERLDKALKKSEPKPNLKSVVPYPGHLIKRGSRGKDVERVQRAVGVKADGIFGPNTERAVKAYQKRHGLTVDGLVGKHTWGVMF